MEFNLDILAYGEYKVKMWQTDPQYLVCVELYVRRYFWIFPYWALVEKDYIPFDKITDYLEDIEQREDIWI